jgi:hypothetical protein
MRRGQLVRAGVFDPLWITDNPGLTFVVLL